jgi:hypothetical protein
MPAACYVIVTKEAAHQLGHNCASAAQLSSPLITLDPLRSALVADSAENSGARQLAISNFQLGD